MHQKLLAVLVLALGAATAAHATSLTYTPVNPDFGGNPANGAVLLNEANAQNGTHAPVKATSSSSSTDSVLNAFITSLQTAVLDKLSSSIVSEIVGPNGQLIPGTLDTSDFTIVVKDLGNGQVSITTTSKSTGQSSTFDISNTQ